MESVREQEAMFVAFQDAAEALDAEAVVRDFADDAVFEFPYAPEGFPERLEGRDAILAFVKRFPKYYRTVRFHDRTITPLADGAGLVAEYRGAWVTHKGRPYENTYVLIMRFEDGRIAHVREFFDPLIWLASKG